jgi:type III restriction enzyme
MESDLGIGNRLTLLDDEILKNLNAIQLRNGLPPSAVFRHARRQASHGFPT